VIEHVDVLVDDDARWREMAVDKAYANFDSGPVSEEVDVIRVVDERENAEVLP
jgi:hypothetical protein